MRLNCKHIRPAPTCIKKSQLGNTVLCPHTSASILLDVATGLMKSHVIVVITPWCHKTSDVRSVSDRACLPCCLQASVPVAIGDLWDPMIEACAVLTAGCKGERKGENSEAAEGTRGEWQEAGQWQWGS